MKLSEHMKEKQELEPTEKNDSLLIIPNMMDYIHAKLSKISKSKVLLKSLLGPKFLLIRLIN